MCVDPVSRPRASPSPSREQLERPRPNRDRPSSQGTTPDNEWSGGNSQSVKGRPSSSQGTTPVDWEGQGSGLCRVRSFKSSGRRIINRGDSFKKGQYGSCGSVDSTGNDEMYEVHSSPKETQHGKLHFFLGRV